MYTTLRKGSTGEDVKRWQKIIGVTADGDFGSGTTEATKAWQTSHKLVPDGVVGSVSWAIGTGQKPSSKPPQQKTPQANADVMAYEIAKRAAPNMPEKHRQYVLAVARGEGFYGLGWGNPSKATIAQSEKYGLSGYEGKGSNNWGAVQGKGDAGSFMHVDYHADGSPYQNPYKRYSTPEAGFLDMARIILGGGKRGALGSSEIKNAVDKGSLRDAVFTQHKNGYFELAPEKYLSAVMKNYGVLTTNTEWKKLLSEKGGLIGSMLGVIGLGLVALVGGGLWLKTRG
jgi:hypothetical protein